MGSKSLFDVLTLNLFKTPREKHIEVTDENVQLEVQLEPITRGKLRALIHAIDTEKVNRFKKLILNKNLDLNTPFKLHDFRYSGPLHYAIVMWTQRRQHRDCHCFSTYGKIIDLLLMRGVDINFTDTQSCNALHIMVGTMCPSRILFAELLFKRGIRIDERNKAGKTPLFDAVYEADLTLINWLCDHGADAFFVRNNFHLTDWQWRSKFQNLDFAKSLLSRNLVKASKPFYRDYTLLHAAAMRDDEELVHLLLDFGARIDAKTANHFRKTPFDWILIREDMREVFVKEFARIEFGVEIEDESVVYDLTRDFKTIDRLYPELRSFYHRCFVELNELNGTTIHQDLTAYGVLSKNCHQLIKYLNLTEVKTWFDEHDLTRLFPLYSSRLYSKIKNVELVKRAMQEMRDSKMSMEVTRKVYAIFENVLPDVVIRNIARYACFVELYE